MLIDGAGGLHQSMQEQIPFAISVTIRTPYPTPETGFFFGRPTEEPWTSLYAYYTDIVLPITVLLIGVALALMLFTNIFGRFLSGYEKSRAKRRFFIGFIFVLAWWGIGGFTLRFADSLATAIAPDPSAVGDTFRAAMSLDGTGTMLGAFLSIAEALVVFLMMIWYLLRWIGIYALMIGMPIGISFWIVDIGPFSYLSRIVNELIVKFVPLAFIGVPAAVIFRVGDLLFGSIGVSNEFNSPIGPFVLSLGFMLLTVIVSYYVFFRVTAPGTDEGADGVPAEAVAEAGRDGSAGGIYKGRQPTGAGREVEVVTSRETSAASTASTNGRRSDDGRVRDSPDVDVTRRMRRQRTYSTSGSGGAPSSADRSIDRSRKKIDDIRKNGE